MVLLFRPQARRTELVRYREAYKTFEREERLVIPPRGFYDMRLQIAFFVIARAISSLTATTTVQISNATFIGVSDSFTDAFYGVPYAQPP